MAEAVELYVDIIADRLKTHVASDVIVYVAGSYETSLLFTNYTASYPKECYLVRTLLMTAQVPEADDIIGQRDVIGQAMEVSFCLCRTANHQRCHFVAFRTSAPPPHLEDRS